MSSEKNPQRVAGGLKATIHNPNISEDTKASAQERLNQLGEAPAPARSGGAGAKRGSAKATGGDDLLDDGDEELADEEYDDDEEFEDVGRSRGAQGTGASGQPGEGRVLGGYKATLKNPRVSKEAKQKAEQVLKDNDAL